jgi:hypothetical protein
MSVERARVRAELGSNPELHDFVQPSDTRHPILRAAEDRLNAVLERPGFEGIRLSGLILPWHRTFEIDFTLGTDR